MSLFSSFDAKMFYSHYFMLFLIFSLGMTNLYYFSSFLNNSLSFLMKALGSFFNSLNFSNYSKNFDFLSLNMLIILFFFNFSSIFCYNFPLTSQLSLVLSISTLIWISMNLFSLLLKFKKYVSHLIPEGSPIVLTPFLFIIEVVSSFIRPITLTVRLVANILAGHLLIILLSKMIFLIPIFFPFYVLLNMVEMLVAFIQSYIFLTLISLYYNEV